MFFLDDDEDLREIVRDLLRVSFGVECDVAGSFVDFLAARDRVLASDLVILDVNLGVARQTGLDAYAWLRSQGFRGKVVFLTGHAGTHPLVQEALRIGEARVLEKPVSAGVLGAVIAELGP